MEVITTKKSWQKICLDGFMYTQRHVGKSANQIVWHFVKSAGKTKCSSPLKTFKALKNPDVTQGDNHPADIDVCVVVARYEAEVT